MSFIHPTAIIDPTATLGTDVTVGPYSVIGPNCELGDGCTLAAHVVIERDTRLGKHCKVSSGAVLGGDPQDVRYDGKTPAFVEIGDHTVIREYVTVHRSAEPNGVTRVGDHCMLMAYTHIAHDCQVGNHVILANNVQMAGYVEIGDNVFISGVCVIHQFVKIGRLSIIGGFSGTRQDVPPFAKAEGRPALAVRGINVVGLKRAGVSRESRMHVQKAYDLLWFSNMNLQQAIEKIRAEIPSDPMVDELIDFVQSSKRGIRRPDRDDEPARADDVENVPAMAGAE